MHKTMKRRNWTKYTEIIDICRVRECGISENRKSSRSYLMTINHHSNSKVALVFIHEQRGKQQEGWKEIVE
jgi:hypothetical protein